MYSAQYKRLVVYSYNNSLALTIQFQRPDLLTTHNLLSAIPLNPAPDFFPSMYDLYNHVVKFIFLNTKDDIKI
jgi:hypothetical protein